MRRSWSLVLLVSSLACSDEVTPPGTRPIDDGPRCVPAVAGLENATPVPMPGVDLPDSCRILEDDSNLAVHRRQVTLIRSEDELRSACLLADPEPIRGLVDFSSDLLFLVRIPDISAPRWAVEQNGTITIGESTTECSGAEVKALRYVIKVPATATVTFHLCEPTGCDEDTE